MTKTLKDLFEVYRPKAKGEQDFVDKHVAIKHKDRNGNKDDVFKATNIKTVDRETEHGYNPGNDEKVYENVEQIDELSKKTLGSYINKSVNAVRNSNQAIGRRDQGKYIAMTKVPGLSDQEQTWHDEHKKTAKNRESGIKLAANKLTRESIELGIKEYFAEMGEEVTPEDLDTLVQEALADLAVDAPKSNIFEHNFKEQRKSKADIVSSIVEKYAIVETKEEAISEENELINKLVPHLSEAAILRVTALYDQLDEENKAELLDLVETKEGINELLNFMIESSYSEKNDEVEEEE